MKIADALKLKIGDWVAPRRDFVMHDDSFVAFKALKPYLILGMYEHPGEPKRDSITFGLRSEITQKRYGMRGVVRWERMHSMDIDDLRTFDKVDSPYKRKAKK